MSRPVHQLSPDALAQAGRLMHFNWLVAADAHDDWLGSWAPLLTPRAGVEPRLLRRASAALLRDHDLSNRYLRSADPHSWLLLPPAALAPVLRELALAMLGGWVRSGLQREQVALQLRVLGPEGRAAAMRHAASLEALPQVDWQEHWPASSLQSSSLMAMGVSCAAAVLSDAASGARERFLMRFPQGLASSMPLDEAQRGEALGLISSQMQRSVAPRVHQ